MSISQQHSQLSTQPNDLETARMIADEVMEFAASQLSELHIGEFIYVSTEEALLDALISLNRHTEIAFDSEGVNLGRKGSLTIASFLGLGTVAEAITQKAYIVDVKVLGGDRVFSDTVPSFRDLLDDERITKITFDCRADSDALVHLFGVTLSGVLDLQVLDQAIRIHKGEDPPRRNPYLTQRTIPYL